MQHTKRHYTLPEIGKNIASQANRQGVAERFEAAAVHKTVEVDLARIMYEDRLLKDLELFIRKTATHHDPHTLYLRQTVPGIGKILRLVVLYAIHRIDRFPSVQEFASYCRLGKCSKESGGKRWGTSGNKIGNAHLTWAFSEAATLLLRTTPQGQQLLARLEKTQEKGKALRILAHTLGRAVSGMRKRPGAFEMESFLQTSGSRAGEAGAELDAQGRSLYQARLMCQRNCVFARHGVPRPPFPAPDALLGHPLWLFARRR